MLLFKGRDEGKGVRAKTKGQDKDNDWKGPLVMYSAFVGKHFLGASRLL